MADTAQTVPLFGLGIGTKSTTVSAQMRTNMYVETYQEADKGQQALFSRPGLTRFAQVAGLCTGIVADVTLDAFFFGGEWVIVGCTNSSALFGINGAGKTNIGSSIFDPTVGPITLGTGKIRAANDGINAIWRDGTRGYRTDLTSTTWTTNTMNTVDLPNSGAFPQTCKSITYCASRFVADDPASVGRFRWSAAGDGTSWNSLDFATAESNPDALSAVFEANGQLILFGTQTIEFWAPAAAGASGQLPFQRVGGANIQWGTTSNDTIRKCNDSVIFVGRNQGGNRQVVQLKGYQAQVISTADIDSEIQNDPGADAATAMFYVANGHPFYILSLSDRSWVYDLRTGAWQKFITDSGRYSGQWEQPAFGQILVTDYRDGRIYTVDSNAYTDDGNTMVREIVSKHAWANLARLSCRELAIDVETGVGQASGLTPTNAVNPSLMLSWSKDNGKTYGNEVWQSLGATGNYFTRCVWRNLGRSRDWLFKLRVTDPIKIVVVDASALFGP